VTGLLVLAVLLAIAITAPFVGADTRWPGAGDRADRPRGGKRYRKLWDAAIAEQVERSEFDRTT
jgi:hypothetical protein